MIVSVKVVEANDHAPYFLHDHKVRHRFRGQSSKPVVYEVSESAPVGTVIAKLPVRVNCFSLI